MKKLILIAAALLFSVLSHSQNCLSHGIIFTSQQEIDNFPQNYPGCSIVEGSMIISGSTITNLNGLIQLKRIDGAISILDNPLINLSGLDSLHTIGDGLSIEYNNFLTDISALKGLTSLQSGLWVRYNPVLPSLNGLDNITLFQGPVYILGNNALTTCAEPFLCLLLNTAPSMVSISNNAPGCDSRAEVAAACQVIAVDDPEGTGDVTVFPVPSTGKVTVRIPGQTEPGLISITDLAGRELFRMKSAGYTSQIDMTSLEAGMYLLRIISGQSFRVVRIIRR